MPTRKLRPVTAHQLRAALKKHGMSQMQFARWLHVAPQTVRRWVSRKNPAPIPHYVDLLIDLWDKAKRAPDAR
ncbi:MAG TPA: helix-turn-helix transcriptional regulator [Gemmatimonadales bacterium]|jgi:DNA-binding transcriptional regulator YiaG